MAEFDPRTAQDAESADAAPQAPAPGKDSKDKKHRKRTVFYITAVVVGLFLLTVAIMDDLVVFFKNILAILAPIIIGAVIAYLCNPILEFYEYRLFRRMPKGSLRRGLSLLMTVITMLVLIALILLLIIPELIKSLSQLFNNYEDYLNGLLAFLQDIINRIHLPIDIDISSLEKLTELIEDMFGSAENAFSQFLANLQNFINNGSIMENVWNGLLSLFTAFKNIFLGIFIAFYILASKEKRSAQMHKFRRAMFPKKVDDRITEVTELADRTFSGFIYGKILDSLVIGILTFVLLSIFEVSPYNILISTFVGITNIIPVFGPFIGAIPSFFIVLISNPSKALLFALLIFIIQQIDGNIIGPKILGDNTGVSSLCVLIAIVVCSSLWGIVGMIIGVPIFAVIIELFKQMLEKRLIARDQPTDTLEYYPTDSVGIAEEDIYYEHSSLRYRFEHSRLKSRLVRMRAESARKRRGASADGETAVSEETDFTDPSASNGGTRSEETDSTPDAASTADTDRPANTDHKDDPTP